jgi:hypothetical protein
MERRPRGPGRGEIHTAVIRRGTGAGRIRDRIAVAGRIGRGSGRDAGGRRESGDLAGPDAGRPQHRPEAGDRDDGRGLPAERVRVDADRRGRHAGAVDDRLRGDRAGQHRQPEACLAERAHGVCTRPHGGIRAIVRADLTALPAGDTGDDASGEDAGDANGDGRSGHTDHGPSSASEV